MPAIFISHSSKDRQVSGDVKAALTRLGFEQAFLDFDKETGLDIGENWEKRLYEELTRCHAVVLVLTPAWLASKWCFAELTQARALGKVILPVLCERVEGRLVLPDIQAVDLVDWNAGGLERLERRLRAITDELARGFTLDPTRPPYPGINAFEKEDAAIYFGRDEESRAVIERLDARRTQGGARFVIIIGASGSGKSSLLKASVLPLLNRRRAQWVILPDIRPEKAPMEALAKALALHAGTPEDWRAWHDSLAGPNAVGTIERLVQDARIADARGATVLLPIDQFEECFTTTPATERVAFLTLLQAAFARGLPFMVVATGRSDVLEGLIESSELSGHYETFPLTAMPPERYPRLIEGPAGVAGVMVEKGLPERITRDVESKEALPLLAYTLALLYRRGEEDNRLNLAEYEALGDPGRGLNPIENSIRLAAEEAIKRLNPSERELDALRDAFVPHLVRVRLNDGKRVRQTARRAQLPAEALRLIDALTEARLLTTRADDERSALVEVTHESLFKTWPALDAALTKEHAFLTDVERIRDAHENWSKTPDEHKSGELLYGLLLERARDWLLRYPQRFISRDMEPLRAFIAASAKVADAAKARQQRIRRSVLAGMAAAIVLLAGAAVIALAQYRDAERSRIGAEAARSEAVRAEQQASEEKVEAEKQRNRAEEQAKLAIEERNAALITQSRFLTDKANDVFKDGDYGTALALALEALPDERRGIKRPYVPAAESVLYRAAVTLREQRVFARSVRPTADEEHFVRLLPGGRSFITFSPRRNAPWVQDAATGKELFALNGHKQGVTDVAFSPERREIVTGSMDGTMRTWDATNGKPLRTFAGSSGAIWSVAVAPGGARIVTASSDGAAQIWEATDEAAPPLVLTMSKTSTEEVHKAAFSPDGSRVVTLSVPQPFVRLARVWDAKTGALLKVLGDEDHTGWTDGRYALTVRDAEDAKTRVWDVSSGDEIGELPRMYLDDLAAFAADGSLIAVVSRNKVLAWGPAKLGSALPFTREWEVEGGVSHPVVAPDGKRIAAFKDRTAMIWNVVDLRADRIAIEMPAAPLAAAEFFPDGRRIATLLPDALRIWDATHDVVTPLLHQAPLTRTMGAVLSPPAFSSDGRLIAAGSTDRTAKIWDIASGALLASKQHQNHVLAVAFLPGGAHLVTASADSKIRLWDTNSEVEPIVVGEHHNPMSERNTELAAWLAISPNGKHVASATSDGHIVIWTLGAGEPPVVSPKFPKPVVRASFSHDGRRMVAVAAEQAWLWDGTKGKDPVAFGDFPETTAASFSPDGKWIVLGNALGEIRIVDSESRENVSTPWQAHDVAIATVEFAPDGRRVLTTVRNNVPRLWDVASGADIAVMSASAPGLTDDGAAGARTAIFSPDGWIATTSLENDLRLWPAFADTQSLIDYARAVMPRQLTAQQRKDFFLDAREIQPRQ